MLQTIRIENFKSVADLTLPLDRVNVLVGANNAGKSSVLQALQFAVSIVQSAGLDGSTWQGDRLSSTLSSQQLVYSPLRDVHALAAGGRLRQDTDKAIRLTLTSSGGESCTVSVRRGRNKNISIAIDGRQLGEKLQDLEHPFTVFVPGLAGIPAYEEFRSPGVVRRAAARGDANSVFRNVLWLLHEEQTAWHQFLVDLQNIFQGLALELDFNESIDEHIAAFAQTGDFRLPIDSSGTGILQTIQILAYVNVYRPTVLLLDEPDSHLHPDNQRKVARLLSQLSASRDFQVVLSTHSRHVLDEFTENAAKIHWLTQGNANPEENISRVQVLLNLGALDTWDRLRNGKTPFLVITEDEDTSALRTLLEAAGTTQESADIWSYRGCTNIESALTLASFVAEHAPGTKLIVHRDRDYMTSHECDEFTKKIEDRGCYAFLTDGTDIDSHFLQPEHVAHLVPELNAADAAVLIDQATNESEQASIEKFTNALVAGAQRERNRTGGGATNYGALSTQARADYLKDRKRYRHGKSVRKVLSRLLQDRHRNVRLIQRLATSAYRQSESDRQR